MRNVIHEGADVYLPDLGLVHVVKSYLSGAAVVIDCQERRWLVSADEMAVAEIVLFTERKID